MAENYITWNHVKSTEYNLRVEQYPNQNRPQQKFTKVSIPGRNGDLYFMQNAFENYTQEYKIFSGSRAGDTPEEWKDIASWLLPPAVNEPNEYSKLINFEKNGYMWLEDSYDPDTIRLAVLANPVEVANSFNRFGEAVLKFNCRPERFVKSSGGGFEVVNLVDTYIPPAIAGIAVAGLSIVGTDEASGYPGYVHNYTDRTAKPFFMIVGFRSGSAGWGVTLTVDDSILTVTGIPNGTMLLIDCEEQDIFSMDNSGNYTNYNANATLTGEFPVLDPDADDYIVLEPATSSDQLVTGYCWPRWWRL